MTASTPNEKQRLTGSLFFLLPVCSKAVVRHVLNGKVMALVHDSGAAQAQKIADRFHLILNLSAMMERVFEERSRQLILPPESSLVEAHSENTGDLSSGDPAPVRPTASQLRRQRSLRRPH